MTSAASRRPTSRRAPACCLTLARARAPRAFTLAEVILTLCLVGVLFGAFVLSVYGWSDSGRLDAGSRRFETLVLMARAEAANLGKKLRLDFAAGQDGAVEARILWEADPIASPQVFTDYTACTWTHFLPTGLVSVSSSRRAGPSAYRLMESDMKKDSASSQAPLEALTFYPDGSCDTATVEMVSTNADDTRTAVIEIDGLNGLVTRQILSAQELLEYVPQE